MRRPLVLAAAAFIASCALAQLDAAWGWWAAGAAVLLLGLALLLSRTRLRQSLSFASLFALAGVLAAWLHPEQPIPLHPDGPYWQTSKITGVVREAPAILDDTDYASLLVDTNEGLALVRWNDPAMPLLPGDRVEFRGAATTLLGNVNFGLRGVEEYYRSRGVSYAVGVESSALRLIEPGEASPQRLAAQLRLSQARLLQRAAPEEALPFLMAVWLGQRDRIDRAANERYVETGTAHMLAVSGLHVGIVFLVLEFLLAIVVRDGRKRAAVILLFIIVFALMTGARVSTLRAAFMIAMYLSARFVNREPDAPTSLSLAAILFLAWNPRLLFDAGFLLSFGSVASLLCYGDAMSAMLSRYAGLPYQLAQSLTASVAVQVLTLPLVAALFQVVPLAAPLANVVAVPLLGLVLMSCSLLSVAGALFPPFAELFGHLAWLPLQGIEITVLGAARLEFLAWRVPPPTGFALGCYYIALLMPMFLSGTAKFPRPLVVGLSCFLLLTAMIAWKPEPPRGALDVLDVGHGDAAVVYPPSGGAILVDGGDRSEYRDYGQTVVLPSLLAHGVTKLDAMVSTHPDRDHIGGLYSVIEAMPVDRVILAAHATGRPLEAGLISLCRDRGIPMERLGKGDRIDLGGARFEVLHPPKEAYAPANVNDGGIVMRLSWPVADGEFSALLTGDIEQGGERLVSDLDCRSEVLRVPHHGSATSSTPSLLNAVQPRFGVVSTRRTGRREAVGPGVEERYERHGIPLWRTDLHGGIRISGHPAQVEHARQ